MGSFIAYTLFGLFSGAAYAIAASGLVLTYATTRVFNIAHGAFGMLLSFVFWDFSVRQGMPTPLALFLVLFVVAPAIGWFIARFVARDLGDAPASVSLVVTVALLVLCIGVASQVYPLESRTVLPFFAGKNFAVGEANITAHQVITIIASVLVAAGLYLLLSRTRIGTAMRASVDNPELLRLFGGKPEQVAALAWMIGISLAGLGGILLVNQVGLDYFQLTLLVINAYAAAMLGKLKSLPLTFVGAMVLGLLTSYFPGYVHLTGTLSQIQNVLPALFLFVVVVALPQAQLRIGQVKGNVSVPMPSLRRTLGWSAGLLVLVALLAGSQSESNLLLVGKAAAFGIVMLSMVLLTGFGGHVSLAQLAFAGVGALTYAKLDEPNLYGLLVSVVVSAAVGAVVALPVLRLTGLYLALATLAFASIMDKVVFQAEWAFGFNGLLPAGRLSLLGHSISSTGAYVFLMAVFLVLVAWAVLLLRRGVVGRLLVAARDSSAACGTLGLDVRWFRVGLFALSAGLAGLGGALYAGLRENIGAGDFIYFNSLLLLLFAVVAGVTSITGAVLGGAALTALPELQSSYPSVAGMFFVAIAVFAILLAKEPNGVSGYLFRLGRWLEARIAPSIRANLPTLPGSPGASGSPGGSADGPDAGGADVLQPEGVPAHAH
jgi:branched-chain amino acid transport system permease protein